jgi:hypothetical protein
MTTDVALGCVWEVFSIGMGSELVDAAAEGISRGEGA